MATSFYRSGQSRQDCYKASPRGLAVPPAFPSTGEEIPFDATEDPARPVPVWRTWDSVAPFLCGGVADLSKGYCRNWLQSQPHHIEIVIGCAHLGEASAGR